MRWKLAYALGVASLVAGAGAGLAFRLVGSPRHAPAARATSRCAPPAVTRLTAAAKRELASYAGRIERAVERQADGRYTVTFTDPVRNRSRELEYTAGKLTDETVTAPAGRSEVVTWVMYDDRSWLVNRFPMPAAAPQQNLAALEAGMYRHEAASRAARIVGRGEVDGRATLHLREVMRFPKHLFRGPNGVPLPQGMQPPTRIQEDTWVDPVTFVPVRRRSNFSGSPFTIDETWLPRTPANLAALRLVIPNGFAKFQTQSSSTSSQGAGASLFRLSSRHTSCGHP